MRYADRLRMVTHQNLTANGTYAISNTCKSSVIWQNAEPRARVALFAIFLVAFLFFTVQWFLIRQRSKQAKETLFLGFMAADGFMILYLILAIIGDIGYACMKISPQQYIAIFVAVDVVESIANLIILFILLFPLTLTLLRHNFFSVSIPKTINAIFLALLTLFCFLQIGITSYDALRSRAHRRSKSHLEAPLTATYLSLYLCGTLLVGGYVATAMRTMYKYPTEYNAHLKWTLPALTASIFCLAFVNFIEGIGWTVARARWTKAIGIVFLVLNLVFQTVTFETLLMVAGSDTFSAAGEKRGLAQLVLFRAHTGGLDKQREWEAGAKRVKTDDGFMDRTRERSERTRLPGGMPRDPASEPT